MRLGSDETVCLVTTNTSITWNYVQSHTVRMHYPFV